MLHAREIRFLHQDSRLQMCDRFWNTAVPGCYAREPGSHGFQQAVWDAFSIAIRRLFARMKEKVAPIVKSQKSRFGDESSELDSLVQSKLCRQSLQRTAQRSITGNCQGRIWIELRECGEGSERQFKPFLFNQAASLEQTPRCICGSLASEITKDIEGNAG